MTKGDYPLLYPSLPPVSDAISNDFLKILKISGNKVTKRLCLNSMGAILTPSRLIVEVERDMFFIPGYKAQIGGGYDSNKMRDCGCEHGTYAL
jgi:hypothetical protein